MKKIILFLLMILQFLSVGATISINRMRTEQLTNPLGLDTDKPRFSWVVESSQSDVYQIAYHVLVASSPDLLTDEKADLWNTGVVSSSQSLWIEYQGTRLKSNQRAFWKVKVYTTQGNSEWSDEATFGIGLLGETHWKGRWIGMERASEWDSETQWSRLSARYFRKEFSLDKKLERATMHIAGVGLYELYVNGEKVGDQVLAPVPTDYRKTIVYNSFDLTALLKESNNAIGVTLGNGRFYTMRQNYKPYKIANFGYPKMRLNLILEFADGTKQTIASDESWKMTADGPIRSNNEYDGEEYDARKELGKWSEVGYDDSKWMKSERAAIPTATLRGAMTPNMKVLKTIQPISIVKQSEDKYILDMGQNMVGWIRMKIKGELNHKITLRFAETLQKNGELYVENLRDAKVTDIYICNGKENGATWAPRFVYHGFRYVEVTGYDEPQVSDFVGEVVSDEMEELGTFECSNDIINRVYRNAYWGILGNYKGMPIDCPQRNERQPWLGDRTMGVWGESFIFENAMLYSKWSRDICEAQREDGCIPDVAPAYWNYYSDNMTWPAALPMSCDMLYTHFGNIEPMRRCYPSIKRWIEHMCREYMTDKYIITKDRYGDWCMPPEGLEMIHSSDPARVTDGALISTAYMLKMLQTMHRFAEVLGYEDDKNYWGKLENKMKDSFNRTFLTIKKGTSERPGHVLYPDSIFYGNNTVTANILPLAFGIVPTEYRDEVVKNVVQNLIVKSNSHVSCGIVGMQWLFRELSRRGFSDIAFLLASNKTYPSYGYQVMQGATTIWELWNGNTANPKMNSGNHVMMLGDFIPWCYENLGGIKSDRRNGKIAFKHIIMKPNFEIQDVSYAKVSYQTPYGKVKSDWNKTLSHLTWDVEIPCNTTAEVHLPNGEIKQIRSGKHHFDVEIHHQEPAVTKDEFLYEEAPFPSCHSASIVELNNGDLVAAYFGGTREKNPDCNIWVSRKPKGAKEWLKPYKAADGIYTQYTKSAFSEKDLQLFAQRDEIIERLLKEVPNPTLDDRAKMYRPAMLELGGVKSAGPAVPMGDGLTYPIESMKPAPNTGKLLVREDWRKPCYNPVLFQIPGGDLVLYYKIGYGVKDWTGFQVRSKNGGKTWSKPEVLPEGFLGPIKNKPEYIDGRIICPSSTEDNGWTFHFEISDDHGKTWKYVGPIDAELSVLTQDRKQGVAFVEDEETGTMSEDRNAKPIYCIQPSILKLKDGSLMAIGRTRNAQLAITYSFDNGDTWSKVTLCEMPNNNSGTDAVTLSDGRHALIYNDFETLSGTPKGVRTPLALAVSTDDGRTWEKVMVLEDSPISQYSYPSIIEGKDGKLHAIYTWRRQRIAYKEIDLSNLK